MKISAIGALALGLLAVAPCSAADEEMEKAMTTAPIIVDAVELIAVLHPTEGNTASGTVIFKTVEDNKVEISAKVTGLEPGSKHAIHIHQYGDLSAGDGSSLGSHYNPLKHEHGLPSQPVRHAGDFGNLEADANGAAVLKLTVDNISLAGQKNPIIGRGLVIHAKADDGSQPAGNTGARIAVGVVGVRNPADNAKSPPPKTTPSATPAAAATPAVLPVPALPGSTPPPVP